MSQGLTKALNAGLRAVISYMQHLQISNLSIKSQVCYLDVIKHRMEYTFILTKWKKLNT